MNTFKVDSQGYWHQKHSVSKCIYHVVFCPKYKRRVLEPKIQKRLKQLIKAKQEELNFRILKIEVDLDQVQFLIQCAPSPGVNEVIRLLKRYTAGVLKSEFPRLTTRLPNLWTRRQFICTEKEFDADVLGKYLEEQKNA